MRAGKMDKSITIERAATTFNDYGTPTESWSTVATVRAQVVQASTEEFLRSYGASSETVIVFRTRYVDGITPADRITYGSTVHDIQEVKEIGRRKGLELRTVARGA